MITNSPFTDAVEKKVPNGTANNAPSLPTSSSPGIDRSPFKDAVESKVPNTRTGGLLPEKQMDNGFSHQTPKYPEPGKSFKIG